MSKNKKYYLYIGLIIFFGFIFRIFVDIYQPLFLDEKYSIFYATQFNYSDLLKNFSSDAHPGFYYLFLKILLGITNDKAILRVLSSSIFQLFGILLLSYFYLKKNKQKEAFLLSLIFSFNPFLNHLSFQLRSYSLVFLFTIIVYLFVSLWQEKRKSIFLFIIFFLLLIGNLVHYVMYIFSFFVLVFISSRMKTKKMNRFLFVILATLLMIFQFFFFNGCSSSLQYKEQFQEAGWIALPSFSNIPRVYLTSLGMDIDVMNTLSGSIFFPSLFFYFIILLFFVFLIRRKPKLDFFSQKVFVLSVIPLLTILLLSYLIVFLSHRLFFNQFMPRISLFIPRIQLPFVTILWIVFAENSHSIWQYFKCKFKIEIIYFLIGAIIFYWGLLNFELNIKDFYFEDTRIFTSKFFMNECSSNNKNFYVWPHWKWIESVELNRLQDIGLIFEQKNKSEKFGQLFVERNLDLNCSQSKGMYVYVYTGHMVSQEHIRETVLKYLDKCCFQQENIGSFANWECN